MKRLLTLCAFAFLAASAGAQSMSSDVGVQSNSGATNQGVSTTVNSYASPNSFITQQGRTDFHGNTAASTPPTFATPAVIGTCATAGTGVAVQLVGGGLNYSGTGGVDSGCDLQRDINIMAALKMSGEVMIQRACAKAEIAKAMADNGTPCHTFAQVQAALEGPSAPKELP